MTMDRDFARRESVFSIPGMDSVVDGYGQQPGPIERRDQSFGFRVVPPSRDLDAAADLLLAQVAPGVPQRLVYQPDNPAAPYRYTTGVFRGYKHALTAPARGSTPHADFTVTWRINPAWTLRYSEVADIYHSDTVVFRADNSETFGSIGVTAITTTWQTFTVDARGTAGIDLPTLWDTGPTINITGPAGGASGMVVSNSSILIPDTAGTYQPMQFYLPFNLPTATDSCTLRFGAQAFSRNGIPFRPTKPDYQRGFFAVRAGVLNSCTIGPLGAASYTGGSIAIDWWRKFA